MGGGGMEKNKTALITKKSQHHRPSSKKLLLAYCDFFLHAKKMEIHIFVTRKSSGQLTNMVSEDHQERDNQFED